MSMEQLKADLKETLATVKVLDPNVVTAADLTKLLKFTLFPTIEAVVEEMDEIDGCVADMLEGAEDILQPETAKIFSGLLVGGQILVRQLRELVLADPKAVAACDEWLVLSAKGAETLAEITLVADEDDDEIEDDDDEDDDEGDE